MLVLYRVVQRSGGEAARGSQALLTVERSGGVAGRFARLRVDHDGAVAVRRPPNDEVTLHLDEQRLANLRSLVAGSHFRSLSSSYFLPRPAAGSGYAWRITHDGVTVATRDGEAPRGLSALMRELARLIDDAVFAEQAAASPPA